MLERTPISRLDNSEPKGILKKLKSEATKAFRTGVAALAIGAISKDAQAQSFEDIEPSSIQCDFDSTRSPISGEGRRVNGAVDDGRRFMSLISSGVRGVTVMQNPDYFSVRPEDLESEYSDGSTNFLSITLPDGRYLNVQLNYFFGISDQIGGNTEARFDILPEGSHRVESMTQNNNPEQFFISIHRPFGTSQDTQIYTIGLNSEGELDSRLLHDGTGLPEIRGCTGITLDAENTDEQLSLVWCTRSSGQGTIFLVNSEREVVAEMSATTFANTLMDRDDPDTLVHSNNIRISGASVIPLFSGAYNRTVSGEFREFRTGLCTFTSTNVDPGPTCSDGFVEIDGVCVCPDDQEQVGEVCLDECGPGEIRDGDTCREETCEDRDDCEVECGEGEVPNEEGDGCREETCEDRGDCELECEEGEVPNEEGDGCREETCEDRDDCEIECEEGEVPNEEGDGCREETCEDRDDCEIECEEGEREEDGVCVEIPCEELGNCSEPTEPEPTEPEPTEPEPTEPEPTEPEPTEPEPTEPEPTEPPVTEPPVTEPPTTEPPTTEPPVTEPPTTDPPRNSSSKGCSAAPGENQNIPAGAALVLMALLATQRRREEVENAS